MSGRAFITLHRNGTGELISIAVDSINAVKAFVDCMSITSVVYVEYAAFRVTETREEVIQLMCGGMFEREVSVTK